MKTSPASFKQDLAHLGRGMMMGAADIVPGVSGGTVALILGIYERLVTAVSHFDLKLLGHLKRREWTLAAAHLDLRFLIALGCGILLSVGLFALEIKDLLENHTEPTLSVFFGLILASSFLVARMVERWSIGVGSLAVIGVAFAFWLTGLVEAKHEMDYAYLFLCGMIGICAMILPGISGAFLLLILGMYHHVFGALGALSHGQVTLENLTVVGVFSLGCAVGLLSFSKCLRWLLARHEPQTMAVLCGFMIGSLRRVWPFKEPVGDHNFKNLWPGGGAELLAPVLLAVGAMVFVFVVDWVAHAREIEPLLDVEDHEPNLPPAAP